MSARLIMALWVAVAMLVSLAGPHHIAMHHATPAHPLASAKAILSSAASAKLRRRRR